MILSFVIEMTYT